MHARIYVLLTKRQICIHETFAKMKSQFGLGPSIASNMRGMMSLLSNKRRVLQTGM